MRFFKLDQTDAFWELALNTQGGPMWLNVHGVGHHAHQNEGASLNCYNEPHECHAKAYFEADGFATLTHDESRARGDKYWSGHDYSALVNPRQLNQGEVAALLAKLPVFTAPEPATPSM
jgi:hypothetical protein